MIKANEFSKTTQNKLNQIKPIKNQLKTQSIKLTPRFGKTIGMGGMSRWVFIVLFCFVSSPAMLRGYWL